MRSRAYLSLLLCAVISSVVVGAAQAQYAGFIGDSRQAAMGFTNSAVSDNAGLLFGNPAGLAWIYGDSGEMGRSLNRGTWHVDYIGFISPKSAETTIGGVSYLRHNDLTTGSALSRWGMAVGQRLTTRLALGLNLGAISGSMPGSARQSRIAADAGFLYNMAGDRPVGAKTGMVAGLLVQNITQPNVGNLVVPRVVTAGVAGYGPRDTLLTGEFYNLFNAGNAGGRGVRIGFESKLAAGFVGRAGFITKNSIFTFGGAYRAAGWDVEYTFANLPSGKDLQMWGIRYYY